MKFRRLAPLSPVILMLALILHPAAHAQGDARDRSAPGAGGPSVTLLETGAEPRMRLRFNPERGAISRAEMLMRMSMKQTFGGMSPPQAKLPVMRMVMAITVDDVAENGDIAYTAVYTDADVRDEPGVMPEVRQQMSAMLKSMKGMTVQAVVSNRGIVRSSSVELPEGADPMVEQQVEGMAGSMEQFAVPVPEEAVGVGATWKVETTITQNGLTMRQTAVFTLTSLKSGEIELDIEVVQNADEQDIDSPMLPPDATVRLKSLAGKGSGTSTMSLSEVMPVRARMKMSNDSAMSISMGEVNEDMVQWMEMDLRISSSKVASDDANGRPGEAE